MSVTERLISKDNTVNKCPLTKTDWEFLGATKPEVEIYRNLGCLKNGFGRPPQGRHQAPSQVAKIAPG